MKLVMLCIALFVFFFGSFVVLRTLEFGFRLSEKALVAVVKLSGLPFALVFKSLRVVGKRFFKHRPQPAIIQPLFDVTPLDLQHLHRSQLAHPKKRIPLVIDDPKKLNNEE